MLYRCRLAASGSQHQPHRGKSVASGDVLVSDDNGVVIVPFARIDTVIERLKTVERLERDLDANVQAGMAVPDSIRDLVKSTAVKRVS